MKGVLTKSVLEADLPEMPLLAPQTVAKEKLPTDVQILVANVHLETPITTVELQIDVGDIFSSNVP